MQIRLSVGSLTMQELVRLVAHDFPRPISSIYVEDQCAINLYDVDTPSDEQIAWCDKIYTEQLIAAYEIVHDLRHHESDEMKMQKTLLWSSEHSLRNSIEAIKRLETEKQQLLDVIKETCRFEVTKGEKIYDENANSQQLWNVRYLTTDQSSHGHESEQAAYRAGFLGE